MFTIVLVGYNFCMPTCVIFNTYQEAQRTCIIFNKSLKDALATYVVKRLV